MQLSTENIKTNNSLVITNDPDNKFYSIYSDGLFVSKQYDKESGITTLEYARDSAVLVYYTYPVHRRVYLVRNVPARNEGTVGLPCLSNKIKILFKNTASRVDKTRRVFAHIHKHYGNAFIFPDDYYLRLDFIIKQKGKIKYSLIDALCGKYK
jgi:hypothetical protein